MTAPLSRKRTDLFRLCDAVTIEAAEAAERQRTRLAGQQRRLAGLCPLSFCQLYSLLKGERILYGPPDMFAYSILIKIRRVGFQMFSCGIYVALVKMKASNLAN